MRTRHFVIFLLLLGSLLLISKQSLQVVSGSRLEASATTPTLSLIAPSDPQPLTDTIDVPLFITGTTALNLGAFEFDLAYDRSLVEVSGITLQDLLGVTADCDADAARCAVAFAPLDQGDATSIGAYSYGTGAGTNDNGVLAVIHLEPKGQPGTVVLEFENALVSDVDGGDPKTPQSEDAVLLLAEAKSATMNFSRYWNHLALPLDPGASSYTAESLCDEMNGQGANVTEIDRWHNGGWEGHICDLPFNDFTLVLGDSYFVRNDGTNSWTMAGYDVTDAIPLNLQQGWNSISLPHTDGYTAKSLCDEMIAQGVNAVEIDRWHNGGWQGHICGLPFNDFAIERNTGYFVKSDSAGFVIPPTLE